MSGPHRKISFPVESVLNSVIQEGDIQELLKILHYQREKVNVDQSNHLGLTAIHHAVLINNLDAVKILLTNGATVNVKDIHGFSPLHTASACGFLQITSLLIVFGADVFSHTKQSELPVDLAKDINIVRLLTEHMYGLIHKELYYTSLLTTKIYTFWIILQRIYDFWLTICYTFWRVVLPTKTEKSVNSHANQNGKGIRPMEQKKDK